MAADSLVPVIQNLLRMMPVVMQGLELVIIFFAAMFYGGIAIRWMRGGPRILRYPLALLVGFACLLMAAVIEPFIVIDLGPLQFIQPGLLISGLAVSLVLALAFRMLTSGLGKDSFDELRREVMTLKAILIEKGVLKHISEKDAKSRAVEATDAAPMECKLVQNAWHVTMQKGKKKGILVVMDSLTGEVKDVFWHKSRAMHFLLSDKRRLAGLLIMIALAAITVVGFRGFPKFSSPFEDMGLTPEMFQSIADAGDQFKAACISQDEFFSMVQSGQRSAYSSDELKSIFEMESGKPVTSMFLITAGNRTAVAAMLDDNRLCYSQGGAFCSCMQTVK